MMDWVHPGLLLILGAWVLPFLRGRVKRVVMVGLPAAAAEPFRKLRRVVFIRPG